VTHPKRMYAHSTRYNVVEWAYLSEDGTWTDAPGAAVARYLASGRDVRHRETVREFTHHRDPGTVVEASEWTIENKNSERNTTAST
jgi:hypothetical protein